MAAYDYRCRTCESTFEVRRAITSDASAIRCPAGHDAVARVWSAVAVGGRTTGAPTPVAAGGSGGSGGGCCGGGCCG